MNLIEPSRNMAWNPPECGFLKSARFSGFFTLVEDLIGQPASFG
jgi:hypothetical protein